MQSTLAIYSENGFYSDPDPWNQILTQPDGDEKLSAVEGK